MFLFCTYISNFETVEQIGYLYKKVRIWHNDATNLFTRVVWPGLVLTCLSSLDT